MKLKNITLEYEDGSTKKVEIDRLDEKSRAAFIESILVEAQTETSADRQYLIMQWKDGWKEVLAVNGTAVDLIRYYVIRRIEDRGRIALDLGEGHPTLIIVERQPKDITRMMIAGEKGVKSYGLESEVEGYEGIFESGGKKEYKKYDKANPFFKEQFSETFDGLEEIRKNVNETLQKKGLTPAGLLAAATETRIKEYKEIARAANLNGFKNQAEVYGLIEMIMKGLS